MRTKICVNRFEKEHAKYWTELLFEFYFTFNVMETKEFQLNTYLRGAEILVSQ